MKRTVKLAVAVVAALALGVGTASANHLSLSSTGFRVVFGEGELPRHIICPLTLEGSFHSSTFAKVPGSLIGYVTRAVMDEEACNGGRARWLTATLPWHILYGGFTGALPNITSITTAMIGVSVLFTFPELGELSCLYRTDMRTPAINIWTREFGGRISSFRFSENERIAGTGSPFCPTYNLIGTTPRVTELETTNSIVLTLI